MSDHRIVTTASVAIPGGVVHVLLGGGIERPAVLVGVDRHSNIALFSVEGATLRGLVPASPQSLAIGTWVAVVSNVAITHPQAALGRIVGRGQRVDYAHAGDILEIDAPSYPGSTGGAVMNEEGDWVAVVVGRAGQAPASTGSHVGAVEPEGAESGPGGVLIALPVDEVAWITKELETYGSVRRGFLGIRLRRASAASESLGVPVAGVIPGSPADSAGILAGDRILAVNGQEVHGSDEVTALVQGMRPGEDVELTVLRATEISPVRVTLGATFPQPPVGPRAMSQSDAEQLKQELKRLDQEKAQLEERLRALQETSPDH
jgi:S1-C subfamily serine protease